MYQSPINGSLLCGFNVVTKGLTTWNAPNLREWTQKKVTLAINRLSTCHSVPSVKLTAVLWPHRFYCHTAFVNFKEAARQRCPPTFLFPNDTQISLDYTRLRVISNSCVDTVCKKRHVYTSDKSIIQLNKQINRKLTSETKKLSLKNRLEGSWQGILIMWSVNSSIVKFCRVWSRVKPHNHRFVLTFSIHSHPTLHNTALLSELHCLQANINAINL